MTTQSDEELKKEAEKYFYTYIINGNIFGEFIPGTTDYRIPGQELVDQITNAYIRGRRHTEQELEAVKLKLWKEIDLMFHGYWRNNLENLTREVQENLVRMRELFGVEYVDGEWKSKQAQGGE